MNSVTFIPFITLPTYADIDYNFGMPNNQNTNGVVNSWPAHVHQTYQEMQGYAMPGPQGCAPACMPPLGPPVTAQEEVGEGEVRGAACGVGGAYLQSEHERNRVHTEAATVISHNGASYGYSHAQGDMEYPPCKLPRISDEEAERGLFDWVASLEEDSKHQHGSSAGSGSGNSAGVYEEIPANSHLGGLQPTLWRAGLVTLMAGATLKSNTVFLDWNQSMTEFSASQSLFTNQNLITPHSLWRALLSSICRNLPWRALLSFSCVVGYMGCRNVPSPIKLDISVQKTQFVRAVCRTFNSTLAFCVVACLADVKLSIASAILRLLLAGLACFVLNAESGHSMRNAVLFLVLPVLCAFQAGPVGRANFLVQDEPMSLAEPLSMHILWECALVTPWMHISGIIYNVSLTDHILETFWMMGLLVTFGSCDLIESSPVLLIHACLSVLSSVAVVAKIVIIQHYFTQPQCKSDEFLKVSKLQHLLTDIERDTQVLHRQIELFQCGVAKMRSSTIANARVIT